MQNVIEWTKPHHGVQHFGDFGTKNHWCTVCDYGTFATLFRWTPGCGFHPMESIHLTAQAARAVGSDWLQGITSRAGLSEVQS